jgi:electron transport complex protein RnfB
MRLAVIEEKDCVGCAKCITACPVDAIVGAPRFLHTVLVDECIGCQLCVAPCPMDCITMIDSPVEDGTDEKRARAQKAKKRYAERQQRLIQREAPKLQNYNDNPHYHAELQSEIQMAFSRVEQRRKSNALTSAS